MDPLAMGLMYLAGALPLIGGITGSTIGMRHAASVGASVLAEDPTQFRNVLILAALPMTQTFYGLIQMIYIMLMYIPSLPLDNINMTKALALIGIGLAGFLAEYLSAWAQGIICANGIAELPRTKGNNLMSSIVLAAYVELWGILGIVFTILGLSLLG
ncbi:MAG: ATPase [Desulfurococcus sp.]|uniref:ATPase n=1 Tax=Desulfurococcus sp. TaxID=51678 RepID=UPI00316A84E4